MSTQDRYLPPPSPGAATLLTYSSHAQALRCREKGKSVARRGRKATDLFVRGSRATELRGGVACRFIDLSRKASRPINDFGMPQTPRRVREGRHECRMSSLAGGVNSRVVWFSPIARTMRALVSSGPDSSLHSPSLSSFVRTYRMSSMLSVVAESTMSPFALAAVGMPWKGGPP